VNRYVGEPVEIANGVEAVQDGRIYIEGRP
jgi:hypothetical protein